VAIGQAILFSSGGTSCRTDQDGATHCGFTPSAVGLLAALIAWLAYTAFALWNWGVRQGRTGSSVGKKTLRFKLISEKTGQPVGVGMSLVRQLAHIVDAAPLCLGFLFPLWDSKRRTLADKLIGTVCVPLDGQTTDVDSSRPAGGKATKHGKGSRGPIALDSHDD
jgi:uncharacterized RDD family membrane protein YckC